MKQRCPTSEEFLKIVHQVDNPGLNAMTFALLAALANFKGDRVDAKRYTLLVKENYEIMGDRRGVLRSKSDLAHILRLEGHIDDAEAYYRQTILGWQEFGQPAAVAHQVECFAFIALARGQFERSARLLGAAASARKSLHAASIDPLEIATMSQAMDQLAEALGEVDRDKVMAKGKWLSLDDAVQVALS